MKKIQVEGITGAVAIVVGIIAFFANGENIGNAVVAAAGAGLVTMVLVSVYNAFAR
jgi:hypothetical protein